MSAATSPAPVISPADLTKVSFSYRCRVWLAMLGLFLFVALYVGLAGWFTWTAYRMISAMLVGGDGAAAAFFTALPAAFLAIFMWKALFFVRHGSNNVRLEITAGDQPRLFDFLHELADEVRAPRPHRVYLTPEVNASVFYDLSILNFFLPSRKNLTIGLGLVNVLNRSEFRAVLAHEFGHFAQRSMAVGRWVYVGEQIAGHIIAKRDVLDRVLDFISRIDLRVAWIGWIMRTVVWSIRSLMEGVFRWVVIAHRALSREMEFQADLVAVSVTGSDALVHALYRLQAADEDWRRAMNFADQQLNKGRMITDAFAVQTQVGEEMRRVLNEPLHGLLPDVTSGDPAERRLFTEKIAQPPRMWLTHPPSTEREANAKRVYIPAQLDQESAWSLFENPQSLREDVTKLMVNEAKLEKEPEPMSPEEARAALDEQFAHESYDTAYRGAYLNRFLTTGLVGANQMYGDPPPAEGLADALDELYPESLHQQLTEWRNLEEEIAHLEAIEDGVAEASTGVIRHRGKVVKPAELSQLVRQVKRERDDVVAAIEEHDRQCRTVHLAAARVVGREWGDYLVCLGRLLHYVEHSETDLNDAHGQLANVTMMATAAGRVSSGKLQRILHAANDLHGVMSRLDREAELVQLPPAVLKQLGVESWRGALTRVELPPANRQNIGQWINVIDSWVIPMVRWFGALRRAALEELLRSERYVAALYRGEEESRPAPQCAVVPAQYVTRRRGSERVRQKKLDWWSRFTLADGRGPAILRFGVAAGIVAAVVIAGVLIGNSKVVIYNGLATPVDVTVNNHNVSLGSFQHRTVSVESRQRCEVVARTRDGREIESFEASLNKAFANYVYNVAGAAPMIEWTAVYGRASAPDPVFLGCPRWRVTTADHIFTNPPAQVETSGSGATRKVLTSDPQAYPAQVLQWVNSPADRERLIRAHATWDSGGSRYINNWLLMAAQLDGFDDILAQRLQTDPADIATLRIEQELAGPDQKEAVLARHRQLAAQHPDDPDWQYIAIRATPDGPEQDQAYLEALQRWPDNIWLNNAVAWIHSVHGDWQAALNCYEFPLSRPGPWYDGAAVQVARIRRLLAGNGTPNLNDLHDSSELTWWLALETGDGVEGPALAYSLMNRGQLEDAWRFQGAVETDVNLLILLAASDGAPDDWQRRALQVPLEEIHDPRLLLYLAALAFRNGQPVVPYLDLFAEQYPADRTSPLPAVRKFIEQGGPEESLDDDLEGLDPAGRGLVLATAIVMDPDQARDEWRRDARALLFGPERPAF